MSIQNCIHLKNTIQTVEEAAEIVSEVDSRNTAVVEAVSEEETDMDQVVVAAVCDLIMEAHSRELTHQQHQQLQDSVTENPRMVQEMVMDHTQMAHLLVIHDSIKSPDKNFRLNFQNFTRFKTESSRDKILDFNFYSS